MNWRRRSASPARLRNSYAASKLDGGWGSLAPVWPFVAGGLLTVGALTGVLMWLAFYSANHGYDDRTDL